MARRTRNRTHWASLPGGILDIAGPGNILDEHRPPKTGTDPVCTCRPFEKGRLGGQRPMLRWRDHQGLMAYCGTCQRELRGGTHRTREAVHVIGLSRMPLGHLDLDDLVDAELMRPEDRERPADPWQVARDEVVPPARRSRGGVLEAEEHELLTLLGEPMDLAALAE